MTVMPPNLPTRATDSMNTGPQISAATAGRKIVPAPATSVLISVATHTHTKYSAVKMPIEIRSGTVRRVLATGCVWTL